MKPFIGLMSGTSMDGIDCALVDVTTHRLIDGIIFPYPTKIKLLLEQISLSQLIDIQVFFKLHHWIGATFADAVLDLMKKNNLKKQDITAIGSHGQTIFHAPRHTPAFTCQLGCAHTIAETTGVQVVADFRTRDMILGGEGAPLAPLYHQTLFAQLIRPVVIVNIGGIANVSIVSNEPVLGFDVGPGNCLMDAWCLKHCNLPYDRDGSWGSQGRVIDRLLAHLLADDFIQKECPKSIGKEYFSLSWLEPHLVSSYKPVDVQATLVEFTAQALARAINQLSCKLQRVLICGGGVHNGYLMQRLALLLPHAPVESTRVVGINPDFIEAQLFAWLAFKTLSNEALDLTNITGANHPTVLGAIYPAGRGL